VKGRAAALVVCACIATSLAACRPPGNIAQQRPLSPPVRLVAESSPTIAAGLHRSTSPTDAVADFYIALSTIDMGALQATTTRHLWGLLDAGVFEAARPALSYRELGTRVIDPTHAEVDVQELEGGVLGGAVTFRVVREGGAWRVASFGYTALEDAEP
jgi:hypothetical protein